MDLHGRMGSIAKHLESGAIQENRYGRIGNPVKHLFSDNMEESHYGQLKCWTS
jgi:hypothetical protein